MGRIDSFGLCKCGGDMVLALTLLRITVNEITTYISEFLQWSFLRVNGKYIKAEKLVLKTFKIARHILKRTCKEWVKIRRGVEEMAQVKKIKKETQREIITERNKRAHHLFKGVEDWQIMEEYILGFKSYEKGGENMQ